MSSIAIALCFAGTVLLGALAGVLARSRLPGDHLDDDTKDMVKIGVGFLATLAALVLGIVVGAAKSSFDTKTAEMQTTASRVLQLDRTLRKLGPEAGPARALLRQAVVARIDMLGHETHEQFARGLADNAGEGIDRLQAMLHAYVPAGDAQREAVAKALGLADDIEQIVALAVAQSGSSITMPLLVLLVFWFAVIAAGWNLFAPRNATTIAVNLLCAASLGGAIFLLLEMDRPFGGVIRVSAEPLRTVLPQLGG